MIFVYILCGCIIYDIGLIIALACMGELRFRR